MDPQLVRSTPSLLPARSSLRPSGLVERIRADWIEQAQPIVGATTSAANWETEPPHKARQRRVRYRAVLALRVWRRASVTRALSRAMELRIAGGAINCSSSAQVIP